MPANRIATGQTRPGDVISGERSEQPTQRDAEHDKPPHAAAVFAELAEIEAQPAFEQDQRNTDGDHRFEHVAESGFGIHDAEHRPGEEARRQHQHDCGPARPPGNPLRADAKDTDQRDDKRLFFHQSPAFMKPRLCTNNAREAHNFPTQTNVWHGPQAQWPPNSINACALICASRQGFGAAQFGQVDHEQRVGRPRAPAWRSNCAAASAVPPVAIRSSTISTLFAAGNDRRVDLDTRLAVFQRVIDADACDRQFARLAHRHETNAKRAGPARPRR